MFGRVFRGRQGCGQRRGHGPRRGEGVCCAYSLSDFAEGADVAVIANSDRQTLEMGLFAGALVQVMKNRPNDANMVVRTGHSRYIISKEAASKIQVR